MNNGDDTEYYLLKGFDVVSVEANPYLCEMARARFKNALDDKTLVILNAAISENNKKINFYINRINSHWSSLDINWASRGSSPVDKVQVDSLTLSDIINSFGLPYYLKTDIEGGDMIVLDQLLANKFTPNFFSIEDCRFGFEYIEKLIKIGYKKFKLSDQSKVPVMRDNSVEHSFKLGSSGLFGNDLPGAWISSTDFFCKYEELVRDRKTLKRLAKDSIWWDIHCSI